ncbi:MAG TPA: MoaD/ThiS family protein [Tepidimicrobium sp.]|nr:MoaD/ThiS family protein [Tepidimicrobium sp.]
MFEDRGNTIELRGFLHLNTYIRKKFGTMPVIFDLDGEITGKDLAKRLNVPLNEIEVIFVNGFVQGLDFVIKPGDRVALLPPGCPGPYRIALGFYGKNQNNPANFKIKERKLKNLY